MPQTIPTPIDAGGGAGPPFANLIPAGGDNTGVVGTDLQRWAEIRGVEVEAGDLSLRALDGSAHWKIIEAPHGIRAVNQLTGESFMFALVPTTNDGDSP